MPTPMHNTFANTLLSNPKAAALFVAGHVADFGAYPRVATAPGVSDRLTAANVASYALQAPSIMAAFSALCTNEDAQKNLNAVTGSSWRFHEKRRGWASAYGFENPAWKYRVDYRGGTQRNERRFELRLGWNDPESGYDVSQIVLYRRVLGADVFTDGRVLIAPTGDLCAQLGVAPGDLATLASKLSELVFTDVFAGRLAPGSIERNGDQIHIRSRERLLPDWETNFKFIEPRSGARLEHWVDIAIESDCTRIALFNPPETKKDESLPFPEYRPLTLTGPLKDVEDWIRARFR